MSSTTVKNAVDTWVSQSKPTKRFQTKPKLWLRSTAGSIKYALVYFNRPFPMGATITSAKLRLYNADAWGAGATAVNARLLSGKWGINKVNYSTIPGVGAGIATTSFTPGAGNINQLCEIDVTALLNTISSGGQAWYGFRIDAGATNDHAFWSAQGPRGAFRPHLFIQWSDAPDEPDNLRPSSGRFVLTPAPMLSWSFSDVSGDQNLGAVQVQVGTTQALVDAGTPDYWNPGSVASTEPQLDLRLTAFTPLTNGQSVWWRCRNQDGAGLWSPWADAVQFGYQAPGVISNLQVNGRTDGIQEATPTVTWAFSGTQKAFQVIVSSGTDPNNWLWDSGKITGTTQSVQLPWGIILDTSLTYIFKVRVWDTFDREANPVAPAYVEATTAALGMLYGIGTPTNVTGLAMTSDPILPKATLTWTRSVGPPDWFQVQRSDDGGVTWFYIAELLPSEVSTGGNNYAWDDTNAKQYVTHQWRVISVTGLNSSSPPAAVSGTIRRLCPVLMRSDGTDACFFMNPERNRQRLGVQGLADRMGGPPVLVTQRLGGQSGHVRGRFVDEAPGTAAYTAVNQRANFLDLEQDSGQIMKLAIANETLDVVAFNFNLEVLTDAQGITYDAEFDWIAV